MSLSVRYIDVPVGAQETAEAAVSSLQSFGTAQQMISGTADIPWATLEKSSWALDGTRKLLSDTPADIGWWSKDRTDGDGRFAEPPVITVSFPQPYTSTGITFWFWPSLGHWCDDMEVIWYNGVTVLEQAAVKPDDSKWVLTQAVEGFDRIEIRLLGTNMPMQFAKIQQIQIGHVVEFLQDEIVRVSLLNEVDPSMCQLSADTMTVEIRQRKDRALLPQQNQAMHIYRDGRQIAAHYIVDSHRQTRQYYTFRCQSAIGRLEDDFLGGIYESYGLEALLGEVLDGFAFFLDDVFAGEKVTGYLPVCTRREALQQIAFAIGAVVTTQGDGTICLCPLQEQVEAVFDGDNIFTGAKVNTEAQVSAVQIFAHRYAPSDQEETLLDNESVSGSDVLYVFPAPHHGYEISGGVMTTKGENWVRITADGPVSLKAKKYIHSASVHVKKNPLATAQEKSNTVSVENATLIHGGNVGMALDRLYRFHEMQHLLTQDAVIDNQRAGQKAESINPWGTLTVGYITGMDSEFTAAGHTAQVTVRGKERKPEEGQVLTTCNL